MLISGSDIRDVFLLTSGRDVENIFLPIGNDFFRPITGSGVNDVLISGSEVSTYFRDVLYLLNPRRVNSSHSWRSLSQEMTIKMGEPYRKITRSA